MKLLVCGGSKYQDREALFRCLDELHSRTPLTLIINGGARGADYLASAWAKERGIALKVFKADHKNFGVDAFMELNAAMLEATQPDLVLAFPGGIITADMQARAKTACIPVTIMR